MKMTEKTKKYLAISGGAVICAGLIVAIGLQLGKAPVGEDKLPEESQTATQIVVNPGSLSSEAAEPSTEEKELIIQPNTDASGHSETSQPADTRPAQTDQTEQSIQPEVTKPVEPEESVKTDPTQKPDGTKVEAPPTPVDHDTYTPPTEPTPAPDQPQAGDVQDGKTYLPGFGYIENSGPNQENYAEDMYENGNKIGSMD
ncbi:DUF6550 family protein [Enterocloster bolteae]|uniref:DUF6550 family protein n=1 Tax=Enterocloster bolteae TaxID=208479 RepID=UPI00210DDE2B|nr:DUF6550 family protein [Enterocloster bolteae]MCQ5144494.1 hypothetical protein [Enterocloster bolteae]